MNVISLLTPKAQVDCLYDDYTVRQGLEKLRAGGFTALPVLDREGYYLGTVTEGDFLWHLVDERDNSLRAHEKHPLMSVVRRDFNPPVSVRVTMDDLLDHALRQSFVPVVVFIGIVTRQSIMKKMVFPMSRRKLDAESLTTMA